MVRGQRSNLCYCLVRWTWCVSQGKSGAARIPLRGNHLDHLEAIDRVYIAFNRLTTPIFTLHALQFLWSDPRIIRTAADASLLSTAGGLVVLFVAYDLTYCLFHRGLHHRSVYRHIHKHHHRQVEHPVPGVGRKQMNIQAL